MTDDTLTVDRPIKGDITRSYHHDTPQVDAATFLAEVDRALAVPGVRGLVWEQYTPYFNDGEPCEFSVYEVRVLIDGVDEDSEDFDTEYRESVSTYDVYNYGSGYPQRDGSNWDEVSWVDFNGVSGRTIYELLHSLKTASWENVARANFGDHAEVTATRDGFSVEYYEHD